MAFPSSQSTATKVCWLASGETLTIVDSNAFAGKPILYLKRFLKRLLDAPTFRQRLFAEDSSVEMNDEDMLDPAVRTVRLVVSNVTVQDIVRFCVTPLPVSFWPHRKANQSMKRAYGMAYEIALTLETGQTHRDIAVHRTRDSRCSIFGLQEWPLILKMDPDVAEPAAQLWWEEEFSRLSRCYTACPCHVPFPVGYVLTELSGQGALSMTLSAALLMEDVGETLASWCRNLAFTISDADLQVLLKEWLCGIVEMTEETHRNQLLWDSAFDAHRICWSDRTERWYLLEVDLEETVETFETRWQRAVDRFELCALFASHDRALTMMYNLMVMHLKNQRGPITAVGLRSKFGIAAT